MSSAESSVSVNREVSVDLPTSEGERMRAIRTVDWDRCKRRITDIRCPSQRLSKLYSTFIGASLTIGISWIVHVQLNSNPFIISMYFWATICFLILAIGLHILETEQGEFFKENKKELLIDMGEIERTFSITAVTE